MTVNPTLAFIATCIGFGFIPGPALLQTVSLTLQHGRRAGVLSALGIHLGAFFQICAVAIGAVVVLDTSPWLYHALRVAGGGYLIWLGIQRIRARADDSGAPSAVPKNVISSSALIEASNPKSALFYLSFLLQFVDPSASLDVGWQLFLLGAGANLLFSLADLTCIALAHPLRKRAAPGGAAMTIGRYLAGALFIALGAVAIVER
ncbi:LysE family translocator [Burkholderia thailandensis]|uniref:LysE family protein n=1 Tax=Burkholderia thailandensis (strain ATCC 700388 / DSM 13276 / CCUG 48851 / CIP 106301 / E264) TaxID=271848 RepID=Q2SYM7_BURTA|nr:LysE family translocator [Burkholderia thailandensis]ABC39498.1 LysE family protein [Burkholderia thailandensis E264]AHI73252.1 lysE type translocator family protein [Burkholderia thailandensis 2002721723]AIP23909.1 lysE type translocator family protein [Burkholderia thailandensis E264]AIS96790.1 lysE type translocator family protein [Burkholderia thailandensis MSMB59]AJY00063.1 lysE type translocator family protein [Burkholderia thailandensis 2002721643]